MFFKTKIRLTLVIYCVIFTFSFFIIFFIYISLSHNPRQSVNGTVSSLTFTDCFKRFSTCRKKRAVDGIANQYISCFLEAEDECSGAQMWWTHAQHEENMKVQCVCVVAVFSECSVQFQFLNTLNCLIFQFNKLL